MKKIILYALSVVVCCTLQAQVLERGVALRLADGKPVEVTSSHAAPVIYDFNGDGVKDLIVGEFGEELIDLNDRFVKSKCRVYINKGTDREPQYADFFYLKAGGKDVYVAVTCCISFVPRFGDMNGDGIDDLLTGDYYGNIHMFRGEGDGRYAADDVLYKVNGVSAIAAEPIDWNGDGVLDVLVSQRYGQPLIVINHGTKTAPKFDSQQPLTLEPCNYTQEQMENQVRKSVPSHITTVDFDGDSLFDLVCGDEEGNLFWYKNVGDKTTALFKTPIMLRDNNIIERPEGELIPIGGRVKVAVYDYNQDGKLDILAGDLFAHKRKIRELSPKDEMKKAKLEQKLNECIKECLKMQAEGKRSKKNDDCLSETTLELRKYDNYEHRSTGYVWLFLQK